MAGQQALLLINSPSNDLNDVSYGNSLDPHQQLLGFSNMINGVLDGAINAQAGFLKPANAVFATGTMTGVTVVATNAVSICGTVFTCVSNSTVPSAVQFQVGASDTATMANLAAAVNAHSSVQLLVIATSASNVVTLQSVVPGVVGNQLPFSQTSGATITCSGSGYLTSGAGSLVGSIAGVRGSDTVTTLPGIAAGAYVTIGGVIFTSVAASSFASAQSQAPSFNIGRNDQQTMANLALAINQCPGTNQKCRATASGLIVTLVVANPQGNPALPSMTSGQGSIVASTPTLTAAPVIVSGNTIVIAGQTLTATVATQNTTNFIVGATDNATLLNIVTTIAANGTLSPLVTGSVVGNTLTITAAGTSPYYNTYAVTTTGSTMEPQWPTLVFGQLSTQAILHFGY
jgi:hypothetical protein